MIDIQKMQKFTEYKKYVKGEVILEEAKVEDRLYFILTGSVMAIKNHMKNDELEVKLMEAGDFFGERGMFLDEGAICSYVADEDSIIIRVEKEKFEEFTVACPEVVWRLLKHLSGRKKELENQLGIRALVRKKKRQMGDITVLFPETQKLYHQEHPVEHDKFLVEDMHDCPNCKHSFVGNKILTSKLKVKNVLSCDLRREYEDFVAYWYDVITCPKCLYSTFEQYWKKHVIIDGEVKERLQEINESLGFDFTEKRTVDTALASLYLAVECAGSYRQKYQIKTRAWRAIAWIYESLGEEELDRYATEHAYFAAKEFYDRTVDSEEEKQVVLMILGTLAHRLGRYDEAVRYLGLAKFIRVGKTAYRNLIMREYDEIKEKMEECKAD